MFSRSQQVEALVSMGYRILGDNHNKWGKPVGYQILIVDLEAKNVSLWFRSAGPMTPTDSKERALCCWSSTSIFAEDTSYKSAAQELASAEANVVDLFSWRGFPSGFEFLTKDQMASLILDSAMFGAHEGDSK